MITCGNLIVKLLVFRNLVTKTLKRHTNFAILKKKFKKLLVGDFFQIKTKKLWFQKITIFFIFWAICF